MVDSGDVALSLGTGATPVEPDVESHPSGHASHDGIKHVKTVVGEEPSAEKPCRRTWLAQNLPLVGAGLMILVIMAASVAIAVKLAMTPLNPSKTLFKP
eukprot:scaffold72914_cov26-Prasinocladus_malaysianus.AAC.1